MSRHHDCHALNCDTAVPPRMHMCARHWRMVPRKLQRALWAAYVPGQERRMDPTADYLNAAANCVRSVAEQEGQPADEIEFEVGLYTTWANLITDDDEQPALDFPAPVSADQSGPEG